MPEFKLKSGGDRGSSKLSSIDKFTYGYVEAMFFTETGDIDDEYSDATVSDISEDGWQKIVDDCTKFQNDNKELLERAYDTNGYDTTQAGHDLWLTRNGHGAGFWDRGLGEIGETLTKAANAMGETYIGEFLMTRDSSPSP